ncbi:MAG: hypothetical protein GX131_07925 [candidate division WS1 bacterium]|jgi:hypothetical protein|nr:hypothetical protein [candidate division WS1 bacterium]
MADVKDKALQADESACHQAHDVEGSPEPWSEERIRRCDEWMKRLVGAIEMPFEVDVEDYFRRAREE